MVNVLLSIPFMIFAPFLLLAGLGGITDGIAKHDADARRSGVIGIAGSIVCCLICGFLA